MFLLKIAFTACTPQYAFTWLSPYRPASILDSQATVFFFLLILPPPEMEMVQE
jgi:hypothetical protein